MLSRRRYALFGVLATVVGMMGGHLAAAFLNPAASPVLVVGNFIVDLTPTPITQWAIRTFDSDGFSILWIDFPARNYDKEFLIGMVILGVLVLAALAGVLARRSLRLGMVALTVLVAAAAVMALLRPGATATDLVPVVPTLALGVLTLWLLDRVAGNGAVSPAPATSDEKDEKDEKDGSDGDEANGDGEANEDGEAGGAVAPTRRVLLAVTAAAVAVAGLLGGAGRFVSRRRTSTEDLALPEPVEEPPPLPRGLEDQVPGISELQTPNDNFYRVDTRLDVPIVDSAGWTLTIDGDVENELVITFDELMEMPMIERDITMTCVSNSVGGRYVGGARWLGVPLNDLLDRAGVGPNADQLLATDFDNMTIGTPLELVRDGRDALVVVGMNGEPLPRQHGFPVRIMMSGLYGFISGCKWVTRLTLTTYAEQDSYWTERGWDTNAPIKPSARIDTPQALSNLTGSDQMIGGVAWAQDDGGVARVQVRIDGGGWQDATLGPEVNNRYWRQWFYPWNDVEPGSHLLAARVVQGDGNEPQTAVEAPPFPGGSSGIHSVFVNVG